ncbi:oxygenase MpaB family protein [Spirosoma endbachense]|uniref:DUF2236 domain-containing protein n=1 Tax=Spirosoma endbachense TaxID=2666025 RepID=A0A6P1W3P4_9BACT|nr:oxygenase MpaB family protein [Spirosoma endbachense]QHV99514.1 DUF2236 domain-containing protein [Spirosoma endbachense]
MSASTRTLWTDDFLNQKRLIGDPLADTTIGTIMKLGLKGELDQLFRLLTQNDSFATLSAHKFQGFSPELVRAIEPFFEESGQLPADLGDPFELNTAADEFEDRMIPILLSLHCKSLPLSYACANGAKVLHQAGRMVVHDKSLKPFTRRLFETAQFVNNLMAKNGFEPTGNAIISVQKVRLMHAAIRFYTKLRPWDVGLFGEPINQEDLALGHQIFSSVIISGLRQLGIEVSDNQERCYLYLWQTVAHILGIQPDLVTQTQADGEYLLQRIMDRQAAPSDEGAALTYACIEFVDGKLQWSSIKHLTPRLMRFLIGDQYARMLQIPGTPAVAENANPEDFSLISTLFPRWDAVNESNLLLKSATRFILNSGLDVGLKAYNDSPQDQFFVPSSLSDYLNQKNAISLSAGAEAQTLTMAIERFDALTKLLKNLNHPLGFFTIAGSHLTKQVADNIQKKAFVNHASIGALYLKSVNRFFNEVNHVGKDEAVAGPWRVVFQSDQRLLTIDQHLLLPGYAYLAYDLIRVLTDNLTAQQLTGFKSDYQHIITLFTNIYMRLIEQLGRIHPDYGWLAGLAFEPARESAFATFRAEVTDAWSFTTQLTDLDADSTATRLAHDLATATVADQIANPTDDSRQKLNELAERQFPIDQPDQTVAAKLDALLADDFH